LPKHVHHHNLKLFTILTTTNTHLSLEDGVVTKPGHSDVGLDLKNKVKDRIEN